ncbi:hypothetical protein PVAP13_8NG005085 [Panicum virgatum]|uniref:Uncharacterized protein n=1 Tax=Panicum virgatum TaxID=38727 RepID=A0A8T0P1D4_PANVG|nr:hypothetical protein PVAP13_8NG005085 [Panicum virgatum]
MRLPSPVLIHGILPAIFFTSHLKEDEGALETGVQWPGHIVVDPLATAPLTSCTPRWCPRPQLSLQSLVLGAQLPHSSALLGRPCSTTICTCASWPLSKRNTMEQATTMKKATRKLTMLLTPTGAWSTVILGVASVFNLSSEKCVS